MWNRLFPAPALAALGLWAAACAAPAGEEVDRFIAAEPQTVLRAERLADSVPVATWTFQAPEDLQEWSCSRVDLACRIDGGRLIVRSSSEDPQLVREVDFASGEVHAIEVETLTPPATSVQVFWAAAGEPFSGERRADLASRGEVRPGGGRILSARLAGHPEWTGRIARLRLDPASEAGATMEISRIALVRHVVKAASLETVAQSAWKVDLDSELRSARLGVPGRALTWDVAVPRGGRLSFALGLAAGLDLFTGAPSPQDGADRDPLFRVRLGTPAGGEEVVFEESLPTAATAPPAWHEREVDLARYAGRRLTVSFEIAGPEGGAIGGLPLWGGPEIVSRRPSAPPPNVVLISVDTLRADHLSLNGYSRATSPRIDAWAAARGVNFRAAVAPSPWTLPSHVSMLTGLDPVRHGVNHQSGAPAHLELLPEILRAAGYTTVAVTGGVLLRPEYGLHQGFDAYRYWPTQVAGEGELADGLERAESWLERLRERPFFLFFHTYEVHSPYRAREPHYDAFGGMPLQDPSVQLIHRPEGPSAETGYRVAHRFWWRQQPDAELAPLPESLRPVAASLYDSGVAYTDERLGALFDRLEELDLARRTIVVLTSDHGESLGEAGRAAHYHNYDENLRVPLVLAYPDALPAGRVVERQVRSVDIVPTVLALAGLPAPAGLDGASLLPVIESERDPDFPDQAVSYAASTNQGLALRIGNDLKYIYNNAPWTAAADREELYLLESDRGESRNRIGEKSSQATALRRRAGDILERVPGLRVRFENDSAGTIRGTLSARVTSLAVKAYELPCACVEWGSDGRVEFEVPAGISYTLSLEEIAPGDLSLAGSWRTSDGGRERGFRWAVDPSSLAEPAVLAFENAVWAPRPVAEAGSGTRISIWWEGGGRHAAEAPAEGSEELRRELEALGYLQGGG